MFRSLLVPLDGSRRFRGRAADGRLPGEAGRRAGHAAPRRRARMPRPPSTASATSPRPRRRKPIFADVAAQVLPARAWPSTGTSTAARSRDVAHSLADHADELESDLVVMLAHGHKQLRPLVLRHRGPAGASAESRAHPAAPPGPGRHDRRSRFASSWSRWTAARSTRPGCPPRWSLPDWPPPRSTC